MTKKTTPRKKNNNVILKPKTVKCKARKLKTIKKKCNGAPSKYNPKYCKQLIDYFLSVKEVDNEGNANGLPFQFEFCRKIKINHDTFNEWCNRHKDFSDSWQVCKEHQRKLVVNNCLSGKYNGAFGIFYARSCLGMQDKIVQETTIKTPDGIKIEFVKSV